MNQSESNQRRTVRRRRNRARVREIKYLIIKEPENRPNKYRPTQEHQKEYQALSAFIHERIKDVDFGKDTKQLFPILREVWKFALTLPHYKNRLRTKDEMMEPLRKFINIFKPKNGR